MSRLDDELKALYKRQEPSPDFTERVLARINAEQNIAPPPQTSLWQRLLAWFQLPTMRWAMAAAAIVLIAMLGVMQYQRLNNHAVEKAGAGATTNDSSGGNAGVVADKQPPVTSTPDTPGGKKVEDEKNTISEKSPSVTPVTDEKSKPHHQRNLKYRKAASHGQEDRLAHSPPPQSPGEMAKAQLMQALFIASATVNEAKKLAIGDE